MSWKGTPDTAPPGYAFAVLRAGDDLATLEREEAARRGLPATRTEWNRVGLEITSANGVEGAKAKTCEWARGVSAWVIGTGGERMPVVPTSPNKCEPGDGFAAFRPGQVVLLPSGLRPAAPPPTTTEKVVEVAKSSVPKILGTAALVWAVRRVMRGGR